MNLPLCVLTPFFFGTVVALGDPCEKISLVFTSTAPPSADYVHEIQLGITYPLVRITSYCLELWYGLRYEDPLRMECSFFTNQDNFLNDILNYPIMRPHEVKLSYEIDLSTKRYVFKLYVKGLLLRSFDGQVVKRVRYSSRQLDSEIADVAGKFAHGRHGTMLIEAADAMRRTWTAVCELIRNRSNSHDDYKLWYNPDADRVYCSVKTVLGWLRDIYIGSSRAKVDWSFGGGRYFLVGSVPRGDEVEFTCVIMAANGLLARQRIVIGSQHIRPRTTRRTPTTRTREKTAEPTSRSEATRVSGGSVPFPEVDRTTETNPIPVTHVEIEEAVPRTDVAPATVAAIVVVFAIVLGGAVGLFVFRGRIRELGDGCLHPSRRSY